MRDLLKVKGARAAKCPWEAGEASLPERVSRAAHASGRRCLHGHLPTASSVSPQKASLAPQIPHGCAQPRAGVRTLRCFRRFPLRVKWIHATPQACTKWRLADSGTGRIHADVRVRRESKPSSSSRRLKRKSWFPGAEPGFRCGRFRCARAGLSRSRLERGWREARSGASLCPRAATASVLIWKPSRHRQEGSRSVVTSGRALKVKVTSTSVVFWFAVTFPAIEMRLFVDIEA